MITTLQNEKKANVIDSEKHNKYFVCGTLTQHLQLFPKV